MKYFLLSLLCVVLVSCSKTSSPTSPRSNQSNAPSFSMQMNGSLWKADSCNITTYANTNGWLFTATGSGVKVNFSIYGTMPSKTTYDLAALDTGAFWLDDVAGLTTQEGYFIDQHYGSQQPTAWVQITGATNNISGVITGTFYDNQNNATVSVTNGVFNFTK